MITKSEVVEVVKAIPEDAFTHIDVVIKELILLEEREKELDKMRKGEVMSQEDVDREVDFW